MFNSKGKPKPKRSNRAEGGASALSQLGLLDMGLNGGPTNAEDDLADLEAELDVLMGGGGTTEKEARDKPIDPKAFQRLESMVAECMRDVTSDDDDCADDDPSLMAELAAVAGPVESHVDDNFEDGCIEEGCPGRDLLATIEDRIRTYRTAEQNAKESGENARARRFGRGLATLNDLNRKVHSGIAINDHDIPPQIPVSSAAPTPAAPVLSPAPVPVLSVGAGTPTNDSAVAAHLAERRELYKRFALKEKSNGNKEGAVFGLKAVKVCDGLLEKRKAGEPITVAEVSRLLPAIPEAVKANPPASSLQLQRAFSRDEPIQLPEKPEDIPPADPATFHAPPAPKTVMEALAQRLERYRSDQAKASDNPGRARRLGRICKQYEDAMKLHKSGKPIPVDELPTPPGFGPIPAAAASPSPNKPAQASSSKTNEPTASKPRACMSQSEKQVLLLEKRQAQFKAVALECKKRGDLEQAKEYLRQAKGFDKLIEVSKGGLPVDLASLPVPPQAQKDVSLGFEIVSKEDCVELPKDLQGSDRQQMYSKLEGDLIAQVKMCDTNREHFKSTGEVTSANKFQQLWEHSKRDLDALRFAFKRGDPVPRFHYEVRAFSKIVCNPDLSDHELEFGILRGVGYNVPNPKEVNTFCCVEFPYPTKEAPFKEKSAVVKDTNNPEYGFKVVIPVNMKEKSSLRMFKRHAAKVEVWSKGGFLRSSTLLGTATVKLLPLETSCTLHDTFPLMDGRRAVGGRLEVKIRLRNAIIVKQVETVEEKWLVVNFGTRPPKP